ncbi:MAG TPA: hypothetical protein VME68_14060 [Acidobacteriaceae bacterium]|nr:hypothetical protein [Acidobacteriaceae bacterium]
MPQLSPVHPADGGIEPGQQLQASRRDTHQNAATILLLAQASDQGAILQPVQEPRNIRVAREHPLGDLPAEQAIGSAAQDAKNVVLRGGEIDRAQ